MSNSKIMRYSYIQTPSKERLPRQHGICMAIREEEELPTIMIHPVLLPTVIIIMVNDGIMRTIQ